MRDEGDGLQQQHLELVIRACDELLAEGNRSAEGTALLELLREKTRADLDELRARPVDRNTHFHC